MARQRFLFTLALTAIAGGSGLALPDLAHAAEAKLRASDLAEFDTFGTSVALRGNVALVGAPQINFDLNGKAYLFRFNGSSWVEEQILSAPDGTAGAGFGVSVALGSEDVALIGAPNDDETAANAGAAYVYRYNGSTWEFEQKLLDGDAKASDEFGTAVAIDANTAAVGAPRDNHSNLSNPGTISLFTFDGSVWTGPSKLMAPDAAAQDLLGNSAAVEGTTTVGGAWWDDDGGSMSGSAYVFGTGTPQKLVANVPAAFDLFGVDVALRGDALIVGMRGDDDSGNDAGSAFVYRRDGGAWAFEQRLEAMDAEGNEFFGHSVSMGDDVAVVGASQDDPANRGSASVYRFVSGVWTEVPKLIASDFGGGDEFGYDVSVDGDRVLVGARFDDEPINAGSAYVIDLPAATAVPTANWLGLMLLTLAMAITGVRRFRRSQCGVTRL